MRILCFLAVLACLGCGKHEETTTPRAAEAPKPPAAPAPDARPSIIAFGDSLSAGFGLDAGQSFPDLLQQDLDRRGFHYRVVNLGISGDTSQDGLARVSLALAEKPAIVLLELGANDGLRGVPINITQQNLASMIEEFQKAGARVILAGMTLPPNYGAAYIQKFEAVYRDLAAKYKLTLIPFLLEGVGGNEKLMQRDGLHPNAEGARRVEALVMKMLEPLLQRP
jgi:acyl-CoA thioesterase-1